MHVDSWFHLGVMHLNGLGVKKNLQQALNYFASAAKFGHVLAQYNLAMLHLQNSGTEKCAHTATCAVSSRMYCLPFSCLLYITDCAGVRNRLAHVHSHSDAKADQGRERSRFCRNGCMAALGWLKKVAERGPLAGVLQDALEWVCYLLCKSDTAL